MVKVLVWRCAENKAIGGLCKLVGFTQCDHVAGSVAISLFYTRIYLSLLSDLPVHSFFIKQVASDDTLLVNI